MSARHYSRSLRGAIAVAGAVITALTYNLNRKIADQTHERDREGQITERSTRAIDQLGNVSADVRLGYMRLNASPAIRMLITLK